MVFRSVMFSFTSPGLALLGLIFGRPHLRGLWFTPLGILFRKDGFVEAQRILMVYENQQK